MTRAQNTQQLYDWLAGVDPDHTFDMRQPDHDQGSERLCVLAEFGRHAKGFSYPRAGFDCVSDGYGSGVPRVYFHRELTALVTDDTKPQMTAREIRQWLEQEGLVVSRRGASDALSGHRQPSGQ